MSIPCSITKQDYNVILVLIVFLTFGPFFKAGAQKTLRPQATITAGNWTTATNWFDVGLGATSSTAPGASDKVIVTGFNVAVKTGGVTIAALDVQSNTLTISGANSLTVAASGSFTGSVTLSGGAISNATTGAGTFSCVSLNFGSSSIAGSITGTRPIAVGSGGINVTGGSGTITNTGAITCTGSGIIAIAGSLGFAGAVTCVGVNVSSGAGISGITSLTTTGTDTIDGTLNCTALLSTVGSVNVTGSYSSSSTTSIAGGLNVTGTGTFNSTGNATLSGATTSTITTTATSLGGYGATFGGTLIVTGASTKLLLSNASKTKVTNLIDIRNTSTLQVGNPTAATLDAAASVQFTTTGGGTLRVTNGIMNIANQLSTVVFGNLLVDGGTLNMTYATPTTATNVINLSTASSTFNILNGGIVNVGDQTNGNVWAGVSLSTSASFLMQGATSQLNITGKFTVAGTIGLFRIDDGKIVVGITAGNSNSAAAMFGITNTSPVTMNGGSITVQNNNTNSATALDYDVTTTGTKTITGGTLFIGNTSSAAPTQPFNIKGATPNLTMSATQNPSITLLTATDIYGDITLNGSGTLLDTAFLTTIYGQSNAKPGNIFVNNTANINYTAGTVLGNFPSLSFNSSTGNQTLTKSGTGTVTLNVGALTLNNTFSGAGSINGQGVITLNNPISVMPPAPFSPSWPTYPAALTLTKGVLTTDVTNVITTNIYAGSTETTYPNGTSYINGPMAKIFPASFIGGTHPSKYTAFMIGAPDGSWTPMQFEPSSVSAAGTVTITANTVLPVASPVAAFNTGTNVYTDYYKLNRDWSFAFSGAGAVNNLQFGIDVNGGTFAVPSPMGLAYYALSNPANNGSFTDGKQYSMYADNINGGGTATTWDLVTNAVSGLGYTASGGRFSIGESNITPPVVSNAEPAPGAVGSPNGLQVWLKADAQLAPATGNVTSWTNQQKATYFNGVSNVLYIPMTTQAAPPTVSTDITVITGSSNTSLNFNPSVNFTGNKSLAGVLTKTPPGVSARTYAVFRGVGTTNLFSAVFSVGTATSGNMMINQSTVTLACDANGSQYAPTTLSSPATTPYLGMVDYLQTNLLNAIVRTNGISSAASTNGTNLFPGGGTFLVGHRNNPNATGAFQGIVSEVAYYADGNTITATQSQQIESYLASKYGITLPNPYLATDGTTVYYDPAVADAAFNKDITVIGRDMMTALNQQQSYTSNPGAVPVYIGAGNSIGADNPTHATSISTDLSFEAFGNDGGSVASPFATSVTVTGVPHITNRMARVWKLRETGTVGMVQIAIPASYFTGTGCRDLLVSTDAALGTGVAAYNETGTITILGTTCVTFSVDFSVGVSYFSFAQAGTMPTLIPGPPVSTTMIANCPDGNSRMAVTDMTTPVTEYMRINTNANTFVTPLVFTPSNNNPANMKTDGLHTAAFAARMYMVEDGSIPVGSTTYSNAMTMRLYYDPADLAAAAAALDPAVSGTTVYTWFKYEGDPVSAEAALTPTGLTGATYLTPTGSGTVSGILSNGSAGTLSYAEFSGITSFSTFGVIASKINLVPVPVKLVKFTAVKLNKNKAKLDWESDNEINVSNYEIQAGTDGIHFTKVDAVAAKNSSTRTIYTANENLLGAITYYRLRIIDIDGAYTYSPVVMIKEGSDLITVYPNPIKAGSQLQIKYQSRPAGAVAQLSNSQGLVAGTQKLVSGMNYMPTNALSSGVYMLRVIDSNNKTIAAEKILIE